ncbi:MAG: glycosyltransferase [Sulfuricellaceae bacterium]
MRLNQLFNNCILAVKDQKFDLAEDYLIQIGAQQLRPAAQKLFEYLRKVIPSDPWQHISSRAKDSYSLEDLAVIVLITNGDAKDIFRTIKSVKQFGANSGRTTRCLLFECLKKDTDVNGLFERSIEPLPLQLREAIQAENLDYVVEYANTPRGLRRAVRCVAGRFVCFVREGDEMRASGVDARDSLLRGGFDVLIGNPSSTSEMINRISEVFTNPTNTQTISALLATTFFYDGAIILDRDYFDDLLGTIKYDADIGYFGYLNEIVTVALTKNSGRVGYVPEICIEPSAHNLAEHRKKIKEYTLYCIESRRKSAPSSLEIGTEEIIRKVLEFAKDVLLSREVIPDNAVEAESDISSILSGKLTFSAKQILYWILSELGSIALNNELVRKPFPNIPSDKALKNQPSVSLVSSLFRGKMLINSFLTDITRQSIFNETELIIVLPERDLIQECVCELLSLDCGQLRLLRLENDPGIYECWNMAIRNARGQYISNANLDDRHDTNHLKTLVSLLDSSNADVASAAVAITHEVGDVKSFDGNMHEWNSVRHPEIWYSESGNRGIERYLKDFFLFDASGQIVQCMNFPHCMPVWRRSLHENLGFFDELKNGTYADFAFWLTAVEHGVRFAHLPEPLGLYYVDPCSHNRRNADPITWQTIVKRHLPSEMQVKLPPHVEVEENITKPNGRTRSPDDMPRINFGEQIDQNYGQHRSGWSYAIAGFSKFHDPASPVFCDTFIEKKFVWGGDEGDGGSGPVRPRQSPWIGFLHVPPFVPSWFQSDQSNQRIFSRRSWQQSLEHCRGLFVLTEYHQEHLMRMLKPKFPISVLYHPTEFPEIAFDFDRYLQNPRKRIVQVGWWLRKLHAIAAIDTPGHIPTLLGHKDWTKNMLAYAERRVGGMSIPAKVDAIDYLDNDAYDRLLGENIVFIDFYDTSANNAVIECIARSTPIVICRHPAVEEYLGKDYPLFYEKYEEIPQFIKDKGRLMAASHWLRSAHLRDTMRIDYFLKSFCESEVIKNLT